MRQFYERHKHLIFFVVIFTIAFAQVAFASAQSLEIDTTSLIDNINQWVPVFFPIFAIGFGIAIAIAIVKMVGGSILDAFKGG